MKKLEIGLWGLIKLAFRGLWMGLDEACREWLDAQEGKRK